MKHSTVLGILTILLFLAACAKPEQAAREGAVSSDDTELRQRVEAYYATMSARDWDAYRDFFWPEATLTTVWQAPGDSAPSVAITSIDEFLANTAQGPDSQPIFEENLISQDVRRVSNLASVWARYEARFGDSTSVMTWRGIDAFTWMKHEGSWRIVSMAYTNLEDESDGPP